jgi:hypothetical protein
MLMINVVYAKDNVTVTLPERGTGQIQKGQHFPADDPFVRSRPDLFSPDPRFGLLYTVEPDGYDAPLVEEATANPGERRSVRRPSAA